MARIEDIKQRLERWSRWVREQGTHSAGYPRQSSFLRITTGVPVGAVVFTGTDEDAVLTDKAVKSLMGLHPQLYKAVMLYYAKGYDIARVAAGMGKAESTVRRNLEQADVAIRAWFVDRADAKDFAG